MKKILCIVLCVVVLASALCLSVYADNYYPPFPSSFDQSPLIFVWFFETNSSTLETLDSMELRSGVTSFMYDVNYGTPLTYNGNYLHMALAFFETSYDPDVIDPWVYPTSNSFPSNVYYTAPLRKYEYSWQSMYNDFWYSSSSSGSGLAFCPSDSRINVVYWNTCTSDLYSDYGVDWESYDGLLRHFMIYNLYDSLSSGYAWSQTYCLKNGNVTSDSMSFQTDMLFYCDFSIGNDMYQFRSNCYYESDGATADEFLCENDNSWSDGMGYTHYNYSGSFVDSCFRDSYPSDYSDFICPYDPILSDPNMYMCGYYLYSITLSSSPGPGPGPGPEPVVREFHTAPCVFVCYFQRPTADLEAPITVTVEQTGDTFMMYDINYGTPIQDNSQTYYLHLGVGYLYDIDTTDYEFDVDVDYLNDTEEYCTVRYYYVSEYNDFWSNGTSWGGHFYPEDERINVVLIYSYNQDWSDFPYAVPNDELLRHFMIYDLYQEDGQSMSALTLAYTLDMNGDVIAGPYEYDSGQLIYFDVAFRDSNYQWTTYFQVHSNLRIRGGLYVPYSFTCEGELNWTDGMGNTHYDYSGLFDSGYYRTAVPQDYADFVCPYDPILSDPNMYMCGYYPYSVTGQSFAQPWIDFHTNIFGHIFEYFAELPNNYVALTAFVSAVLFLCGVTTCVVLFFKRRRG